MTKWIWIGGGVILFAGFLAWLFWASTRPLPGEKQIDLGRGHVPIGEVVEYNTNPPTSGKHYEEWTRAGVYSEPKDDRNLVHSLEHGYIVMSYGCGLGGLDGKEATDGGEIASSPAAPRNDDSGNCDHRKSQLEEVYNKKGKRKLIVVPRENLDTNFAITAWQYLDKFDIFDSQEKEKFIDAHRDNGPEKTME